MGVPRRAAVLAGVWLVAGAGPAAACDWPGWPAVADVVTALEEDEPLRHFGREDDIVGVHVVEVLARAPALQPVTSSRAGSAVVRSWGEETADPRAALHPPSIPYLPALFIGLYGHGCARLTHPPAGTEVLVVSVRTEHGGRAYPIGRAEALDDTRTREVIEAAWGDPTVAEPGATDRALATAYAWAPIVLSGVVVAAGVLLLGRCRRRRRAATP